MVFALSRTLEFKKVFNYLLISIDGSFIFTQGQISFSKDVALLLYYLYCLCKSVQRPLLSSVAFLLGKRMQR